jgi:hypothetical protein
MTIVNRSAFWRSFVRRFGAVLFGVLAQFCSAFWRILVRRLGKMESA